MLHTTLAAITEQEADVEWISADCSVAVEDDEEVPNHPDKNCSFAVEWLARRLAKLAVSVLAAYNWRELFFRQADFSTPSGPLQTALTFFVFKIGSSDFYTVRITPGWNAQKWYPCVYFRNRGYPPSVLNPFWKSWIFKKEHFSKNIYPYLGTPFTK